MLGLLFVRGLLKKFTGFAIIGRDAKRLFQPFACLEAFATNVPYGLQSRLSLRRNDNFDDSHDLFSFEFGDIALDSGHFLVLFFDGPESPFQAGHPSGQALTFLPKL